MLERLRATFRWRADGLTVGQLATSWPTSSLAVGGLLEHLAVVENDVCGSRVGRPVTRFLAPNGVHVDGWQFEVGETDSAADLYGVWDDAVARSRAAIADIVSRGQLDEPGALEFEGRRPSVRRHVCDLIEEHGRHTGQVDLHREAIDGRVVDDPSADWEPVGSVPG
jgi:hypothetical protein